MAAARAAYPHARDGAGTTSAPHDLSGVSPPAECTQGCAGLRGADADGYTFPPPWRREAVVRMRRRAVASGDG